MSICLDFGDYVLAFVSGDNLFTVRSHLIVFYLPGSDMPSSLIRHGAGASALSGLPWSATGLRSLGAALAEKDGGVALISQ